MTDRFRRPRRRASEADRINTAFRIGAVRHRLAWFKPPALKATREVGPRPRVTTVDPSVSSFAGAKAAAHRIGEHWADLLLKCPNNPADRGTARFAGKPYHWRQDYTGQLKLAAGESPW